MGRGRGTVVVGRGAVVVGRGTVVVGRNVVDVDPGMDVDGVVVTGVDVGVTALATPPNATEAARTNATTAANMPGVRPSGPRDVELMISGYCLLSNYKRFLRFRK